MLSESTQLTPRFSVMISDSEVHLIRPLTLTHLFPLSPSLFGLRTMRKLGVQPEAARWWRRTETAEWVVHGREGERRVGEEGGGRKVTLPCAKVRR